MTTWRTIGAVLLTVAVLGSTARAQTPCDPTETLEARVRQLEAQNVALRGRLQLLAGRVAALERAGGPEPARTEVMAPPEAQNAALSRRLQSLADRIAALEKAGRPEPGRRDVTQAPSEGKPEVPSAPPASPPASNPVSELDECSKAVYELVDTPGDQTIGANNDLIIDQITRSSMGTWCLHDAVRDPSCRGRGTALLALCKMLKDPLHADERTDYLPLVIGCLGDRDAYVRRMAADGLRFLQDQRSIEALVAHFDQPGCREALMAVVGSLFDSRAEAITWWRENHCDYPVVQLRGDR